MKVNGVVPLLPSGSIALAAATESEVPPAPLPPAVSSLRMLPVAVAVLIVAPPDAFDSVMVNPSSGSTVVSPDTLMVIVFDVSPALKVTVPEGKLPPKSAASAAAPPEPVTA